MKLRLWRYEMTVTLRKRLSKAEEQAIVDRLTEGFREMERQWAVVTKRMGRGLTDAITSAGGVTEVPKPVWWDEWLAESRTARGDYS